MTGDTRTTIVVPFEITHFEQTPYDEPAEGPPMTRGTVRKRFTGRLEGTSSTEMLTVGQAGYVASERVEGTLDGRRGTFALQHGGVDDEGGQRAFGHVVPGSGTGELAGLRGDVAYAHDEAGARLTLTFSL
jgi:hypothetical protein